jgi:alpha-tubulin suppressor-like RCC1 family protein
MKNILRLLLLLPSLIKFSFSQSIVATGNSSFVIKKDGTLWACGLNENGILGDNSGKNQSNFVQIGNDTNWLKIKAGPSSALALKNDGTIWKWGGNDGNQPNLIGMDDDWIDIGYSFDAKFAIKSDGTLWGWGNNLYNDGSGIMGVLGDSTLPQFIYKPTRIGSSKDWKRVFSFGSNTYLLKKNGTLWGWGNNNYNQLLSGVKKNFVNQIIQIGTDSNWSKISALNSGSGLFYGLKNNGTLWCFGNNYSFKNNDSLNYAFRKPIQIGIDTNWIDIDNGIAIKKEGSFWNFNNIFSDAPLTLLKPFKNNDINEWVSASMVGFYGVPYNTLAIRKNGILYSSGRNHFGQIGNGVSGNKYIPTLLGKNDEWIDVSFSPFGTSAIKSDSTLWAWGEGFNTKLPKQFSNQKVWKKIIAGSDNSAQGPYGYNKSFLFAIKNDNTLWGMGANGNGILGDSSKSDKSSPSKINTLQNIIDISTSGRHVLALSSSGKIYSWGENGMGQLGTGNKINRLTPAQIGSDSNWSKISCGGDFSVGLKKDGTLWLWGRVVTQEKSDSNFLLPTRISSDTDWKEIASSTHVLLLKNNGSLYVFGSKGSGNFGDSSTDYSKGTGISRIGTDSNWVFIAAGSYNSFGIKSDSTLYAWGQNGYNALGINTLNRNYLTPQKVNNDKNWKLIRIGGDISGGAAIKIDKSLWVWGSSFSDNLGFNDNFYDSLQNTGFYAFTPERTPPIISKAEVDNKYVKLNIEKNYSPDISCFKIYKNTDSISDTSNIKEIGQICKPDSLIYIDSFTVTENQKYYYRVKYFYKDGKTSQFSNQISIILLSPPDLINPTNNSIKKDTTIVFKWSKVVNTNNYNVEYSLDSLFKSSTIKKVKDTSISITSLKTNSTYFWRVNSADTITNGKWSKVFSFQTFIPTPKIDSIKSIMRKLKLFWKNSDTLNIKYIKIIRDTLARGKTIIDSISGNKANYTDTTNLKVNKNYFYRLIFGNYNNVESDTSISLSASPTNSTPIAVKLQDKNITNIGEYNFVKLNFSASGSRDLDGTISKYIWYVNDSIINQTDSSISYFFKLGSNTIKLIVTDNDGGKDSSVGNVNLTSYLKQFKGGILGGVSALNQNNILTADTTFDILNGSSVTIMDRKTNNIISLIVPSKIYTTPSISSDSLIFITNGSNLNGFSKNGVSLWPAIPLGGISQVTPTIDSLLGRIYFGVSNKNFFSYDYKTGKNVWSYLCDAPINTSAVITKDRKLIFTSENGVLYGFDISSSNIPSLPKWKIEFGDKVLKSPAVDLNNDIYVSTDAGRLIRFKLNNDGTITVKWNVTLSSSIKCSPVIDADGYVYVGNEKGDFYKLDPLNGKTIWVRNLENPVRSTPSISEYGTIYVANTNGKVWAITTDNIIKWKYQDNNPISANILYIKNMLYLPSEKGSLTAIYDNPNSIAINTNFATQKNQFTIQKNSQSEFSKNMIHNLADYWLTNYKNNGSTSNANFSELAINEQVPIWGTFQGDFKRTGSLSVVCPTNISISRDNNGNLITNIPYKFEWYKNGALIQGVDSSVFKPTESNTYSAKLNIIGCPILSSSNYYYLTTAVSNFNNNEYFKIFPNPTNGEIHLNYNIRNTKDVYINVIDMSGRTIINNRKVNNGTKINLESSIKGSYIIQVKDKTGRLLTTEKLIKN